MKYSDGYMLAMFKEAGKERIDIRAILDEARHARKLQQRREQPDELLTELLVPWTVHPILQGNLM